MPDELTLRPITDADALFLYQVYASTRQEELALLPWTDEQKQQFLLMQFNAQHAFYQQNYPGATFDVLVWKGDPAGRLYVQKTRDEVRIIDIALLPAFRRLGIGSRELQRLIAEASAEGLPVRIHVEKQNPALRLYERLGFRLLEDRGVYLFLEHPPLPAA